MPLDQQGFEIETKPDVFSLEGLIAWLELQPPLTAYDFLDCGGQCLIGRYLIATTGKMWREHGLPWGHLPFDLRMVAVGRGHTYGAALDRARELLANR